MAVQTSHMQVNISIDQRAALLLGLNLRQAGFLSGLLSAAPTCPLVSQGEEVFYFAAYPRDLVQQMPLVVQSESEVGELLRDLQSIGLIETLADGERLLFRFDDRMTWNRSPYETPGGSTGATQAPLAGHIYIARNPAFPSYLKIGATTREPTQRLKELSASTSVPCPFEIVALFRSEDVYGDEGRVHSELEPFRTRGREFFKVSEHAAIATCSRFLHQVEAAL